MSHKFYINVPNDYKLEYTDNADTCEAVVKRVTGAKKVEFVRNSHSGISSGDCYRVTVNNKKEELIIYLKTEFEKVPDAKVAEYFAKSHDNKPWILEDMYQN